MKDIEFINSFVPALKDEFKVRKIKELIGEDILKSKDVEISRAILLKGFFFRSKNKSVFIWDKDWMYD